MYEFRCTDEGLYYYDPVVREERFAPNTLIFLLGYSRVFGDNHVSDKLFIPHVIPDSSGVPVALTNLDFLLSARAYLTKLDKVEITDSGDLFELYGLTEVLEQIGFFSFYKSSNSSFSYLDRVPHVPLFVRRSQDYKRVSDILENKDYWGTGSPDKGNTNSDNIPLYSVYNTSYKGGRAESLDLYNSFGSLSHMKRMYDISIKPVVMFNDMCSFFIWDSLSYTTLYQFSLGVLYGMSQLGYGMLPFLSRPTEYAKGFKFSTLVDEAFFWFNNIALSQVGVNELYNIDKRLFITETYPDAVDSNRILSSTVDREYLYKASTDMYSVDGGASWVSLDQFRQWSYENNNAYPVTSYTDGLYLGATSIGLPLSDWEWDS